MPTKPRIEYLDLAKGLCITLVVLYHITISYHAEMPMAHVFRAIRLPLYFFLSGCFFKQYNGFFDFLKRKTNKLLIPFVFWFLFISVIIAYIYGQLGIPVFTRHPISPLYSFRKLYHETNFVNLPIWFLLCLFEINIIFYLIHSLAYKFFKRRQTLAICLLSMMLGAVGLLLFRQNINLPFYLDRALDSTPFFAFGYVCFRNTKLLQPNPTDKFVPLILVSLALFLYFFAPRESVLEPIPVATYNYLLYHVSGFVGATFIILLSKWIQYIPVVRWWGRYSIMILILHGPFYLHIVRIFKHYHLFTDQPWTASLITLALTMLCCSVAIPICKRFFPHVTAQKDILH